MKRPEGFSHGAPKPEQPGSPPKQHSNESAPVDAANDGASPNDSGSFSIDRAFASRRGSKHHEPVSINGESRAESTENPISATNDIVSSQEVNFTDSLAGLNTTDDLPFETSAKPNERSGSYAQQTLREYEELERRAQRREKAERQALRAAAKMDARAQKKSASAEVRRFTAETRRKRNRVFIIVGSVAAVFGLLVALVYSPLMAVRSVEVEGTQRMDPAEVVTALEPMSGTPLAAVTDANVQSVLAQFPLIQSFSVEAAPPSTLVIHIVERQPIVGVFSEYGVALVDPAGIAVEFVAEAPQGIPYLENLQPGSDGFAAVVAVVRTLPEEVRLQIATAKATSVDDVEFVLSTGQTVVWGGPEESRLKGDVLAALLAAHDPSTPAIFDVSAPDHPVIR
ncbi:FtsQ-type POTRA domain-containing protein [Humidisolicoccus flavus]|uniref:FtsQ-type POTRA domain-containing protein n=1 Tax=Humidisolicoccus flavus TaxID=3111414 RepID=UPI003251D6EC